MKVRMYVPTEAERTSALNESRFTTSPRSIFVFYPFIFNPELLGASVHFLVATVRGDKSDV